MKKLMMSLLVLYLAVPVANAQDPSQPYVPDGHILVNPKPGVVANTQDSPASDGMSTDAVVYLNIGGGDAYLTYVGWPVNHIYGHANTYLNNWVQETGVLIMARVDRFTVASTSILENNGNSNSNATGGDSIHHQLGPLGANCGDPAGLDTSHRIWKSGIFDWEEPDTDFWIFCE